MTLYLRPVAIRPGGGAHGWKRLLLAVAAALAIVAVLVPGLGTPASAAVNPNINVTVTSLVRSTSSGQEQDGVVYVRDIAKMNFTWDATNANPQPGDQFTIGLPAHFANFEYPKTSYLTFGGTDVGECKVEERTITCTLNEAIRGKTNIRGAGYALLEAVAATDATTSDITVNDVVQVVDNPGGGPIGVRAWEPAVFYKHATPLKSSSDSIEWSLSFSGNIIKTHLGSLPQSITFHDVMGGGQAFLDDPSQVNLTLGASADNPTRWTVVAKADGTKNTDFGDYSVSYVVQADGSVDFTVTGPLAMNQNYHLKYNSRPTTANGLVQPGFNYENTATLVGSNQKATKTIAYSDSFVITIEMKDGFGSFKVAKFLTGDGAGMLPAETEYTVNATWTLPDGKTTADYPGWAAPPNPLPVTVKAGQTTQPEATFPVGTAITFEEDLGAVLTPAGVSWGTPTFSPETIVITNQQSREVQVTNEASAQLGTFAVAKTTTGDEGMAANKRYSFTYECDDAAASSGTIVNVSADGQPMGSGVSLPLGTACTVKEVVGSAQIDGFTLREPVGQTVTINSVTDPVELSFENVYTRDTGSLELSKSVLAEEGFPVPAGGFPVSYTCTDGTNGTVYLAADQSETIGGIQTGAQCTVSEDEQAAQVAGYTLAAQMTPSSSVTILKDQTARVDVTNTYVPRTGSFQISKEVLGDAGALVADKTYTVDYQCTDARGTLTNGSVELKAGEVKTIDGVREGSCTVTEAAADVDNADLETTYSVDGAAATTTPATITVTQDGGPSVVKVTNTYALHRGDFAVSKTVTGDGVEALAADKEYAFSYECTDGTTGTIAGVAADGTARNAGVSLPVGTACTVSEDATLADIPGYTVVVPADQTVSIAPAGQETATTEFVNAYTPEPVPPATPTPEPSASSSDSPAPSESGQPGEPSLARTGTSVLVPLGVVLIGLVAGGALVLLRRRCPSTLAPTGRHRR